MMVHCDKCVGSAIGTRLQLYRARWREKLNGRWECFTHARKGDEAQFKPFWVTNEKKTSEEL